MTDSSSPSPLKTKKIYLNGKFVGEIPAEANALEDMRAGRELIQAKGLHKEITIEQSMYNQAFAFAKTSAELYERGLKTVPRDGNVLVPWIVNGAFSIEIYLKTLGKIYGAELRGHKLRSLFDELPNEARQAILDAVPESLAARGRKDEFDLANAISQINSAFVEWRYCYEVERTNSVSIEDVIVIMQSLHKACSSILK